jgi:hypothetical protein
MTADIPKTSRVWYREPFVWMVVAIPAASVVMGVVLLTLSISSYDGLVVDDYYKRGLEINREIRRDAAAASLGLRAGIAVDPRRRRVEATLSSQRAPAESPQRLELRLLHPTRSGFDQLITLERVENGRYAGPIGALEPGKWHLHLETPEWRLLGRMPVPGTGLTDLAPAETD